ncbi:MAG: Rpn family recombination-promoting nuclease/putative transposase [Spirochaetaceae bacterium]|nr:Rpn family recombination-promoting nuclease/putative transposase [Spirochaetaceae bacterium]
MSTKTIAEANLYDDELFLFSCYGNTAMIELILGIILGQPVKVRSFTPQKTLTNAKLSDKSVRFDVELADRTMCDIEVQNTLDAGFRQRTRYNAASLDTHMLRKGQHYTELRRSIVVVITPSDSTDNGTGTTRSATSPMTCVVQDRKRCGMMY